MHRVYFYFQSASRDHPSYQQAVYDQLRIKYEAAGKNKEKKSEILDEFCKKYTATPIIWKMWLGMEWNGFEKIVGDTFENILQKALSQFRSPMFYKNFPCKSTFLTSIGFKYFKLEFLSSAEFTPNFGNICNLEQALTFPHYKMEDSMKQYQEYGTRPLTSQETDRYLYVLEESKKITFSTHHLSTEEMVKECTSCLTHEYSIVNFEWYLSEYYGRQDLWFSYIDYLDTVDGKKALDVYRRYCRLFFEDSETLEKYRKKLESFSTEEIDFWWIDTIQFELDFNSVESAKRILCRALRSKTVFSIKIFNFLTNFEINHGIEANVDGKIWKSEADNSIQSIPIQHQFQYFKFDAKYQQILPMPSLRYIIEKCNYSKLKKLAFTCKLIFQSFKIQFCHNLVVDLHHPQNLFSKIINETFYLLSNEKENCKKLSKVFIGNKLRIYPGNNFSTIVPKIFYCENFYIESQTMTMNEYNHLTKHGHVKILNFYYVKIFISDGIPPALEDLLFSLPRAQKIELTTNATCTKLTAQKMASFERFQMLEKFLISKVDENFDIDSFLCFFKGNSCLNSEFEIWISKQTDINYFNSVQQKCEIVNNQNQSLEGKAAPQIKSLQCSFKL